MDAVKTTQDIAKQNKLTIAGNAEDKGELLRALINSEQTHKYYDENVKQAEKNKIIATGKGIDKLLKKFTPRESTAAFNQRKEFTKAITPAVYNSLKKPFNKVGRNSNVKINIDLHDEKLTSIVQQMRKSFFSNHRHSSSQGLDNWLKDDYMITSFIDPNAWVVIEWETVSLAEIVKPQPSIISSAEALNYSFDSNVLEWLFVKKSTTFKKLDKLTNSVELKDGVKYILYAEGQTLTAEECCENYLSTLGLELEIWSDKRKKSYLINRYDTKLDLVPAFRLGYARDISTNMKTYNSPFEPAMCYFDKSIKLSSEFDLSTMLHAFPQKTEFAETCEGTPIHRCNKGYIQGTSDKCGVCNGTGFKSITSAQDVKIVPMPSDLTEISKIDLSKLTHYDAPPVELLRFQNEMIENLRLDSHLAIFSSTIYASKDLSGAKTATEVTGDFEGIYDAIEPFTEKISELFKDIIVVLCHIAGASEKQIQDAIIIHKYPADLKLKTIGYLLRELKAANDAGAPTFMVNDLTNDMANIVYADAPLDKIKYNAKQKFYPFAGKSKEEVMLLMNSQYISEDDKILYSNFETIFKEIDIDQPNFYLMDNKQFLKQWEIVKAKIQEFKDRINEDKPSFTGFDLGGDTDKTILLDDEEEEEETDDGLITE